LGPVSLYNLFSSKLEDLNCEQKTAVDVLFKGVWSPEYAVHRFCKGFESNVNCAKHGAKAGSLFIQDGTGVRYFLIRPTGGGKWDAVRIKENKKEKSRQNAPSAMHGKMYREFVCI
jgi:hypothetical protein